MLLFLYTMSEISVSASEMCECPMCCEKYYLVPNTATHTINTLCTSLHITRNMFNAVASRIFTKNNEYLQMVASGNGDGAAIERAMATLAAEYDDTKQQFIIAKRAIIDATDTYRK